MWQPRQFDLSDENDGSVTVRTRHGQTVALCPCCGGERHPAELVDVSAAPEELTGGVTWACGACVSRWTASGSIARGDLARALGAPEEHAQALEEADGPDLAAVEANLLAEIDREAEAERAKYITLGDGQAMTYEQKRQELARFDAGDEGPFPFLDAEAAARGLDVADVAAEVRTATDQWRIVGAQIEAKRLAAKAAVRAADTLEGKRAAAQVDWSVIDG